MTISLSGLAVGSIVGIIMNAVLPDEDFRAKRATKKQIEEKSEKEEKTEE